MKFELPSQVFSFLNYRENAVNLATQYNKNALIGWYAWSFLSYLLVREFKSFPLRIIFHRLASLTQLLIASAFGFLVFITGK